MFTFPFFKDSFYIFEEQSYRDKEVFRFTTQMTTTAKAGPGQNQEPGVLSGSAHGCWDPCYSRPFSASILGRKQGAGWQVQQLRWGCWPGRWQLNLYEPQLA